MLRNCTAARYEINKARMVRLAEYSRDCLRELRADTGIAYDERMQGTLQLFRTQKQLDGTAARHRGPASATASPSSCSTAPAASATSRRWRGCSDKFVGGLLLPGDETGDCFKFTQALADARRRARRRRSATARRSSASSRAAAASTASSPTPAR